MKDKPFYQRPKPVYKPYVKPAGRQFKRNEHNINDDIRHGSVRVVGEGIVSQVLPIRDAIKLAKDAGLDLIEINAQAVPPICKIDDYQKFLYDKKKKDKINKKKNDQVETKELRLTPQTDEHDLEFKTKHAREWLENGCRVRASVFFKGRSIMFKEQGQIILAKLATALEDVGKVESMPRLEGKRMFMNIVPGKAK